jgi:hypothetical protein
MDQRMPGDSLGSIAATLGTVLLVSLATLALFVVGVVLVYVGFVQPGTPSIFAAAYVALVVLVPMAVGRRMRAGGSGWRRVIAACAAIVLAVSVCFFPFAALAFSI